MFRSRSSAEPNDDAADARRRPSRRVQSAVVGLAAIVSGSVLLISGALDDSTQRVDVEPATAATTVPTAQTRPLPAADSPMMTYLTALRTWTDCIGAQSSSVTCGTAPVQPDDAQLNAYLAEVLDWNKCAAPRLRHGGLTYAEEACGPQPISPLDG